MFAEDVGANRYFITYSAMKHKKQPSQSVIRGVTE